MDKLILTQQECENLASMLHAHARYELRHDVFTVHGVPRGGTSVAYLMKGVYEGTVGITDNPSQADLIVDDIVDSGATKARYIEAYGKPFLALTDFIPDRARKGRWIVFPWEQPALGAGEDTSADDIVLRLLQYVGEDPKREGLRETPKRVLKAWKDWTAGYGQDPQSVLKLFEDGGEGYDEMVLVKDLPFYSCCEHHLAPFFGTATIGYIPAQRVVGLSKLQRVLNIFAKRLQVQERLTTQVAEALLDGLKPKGVGVVLKARHLCMESRGISTQGHHTITSALRGNFRTEEKVRAEFLSLAQSHTS